MPRRHVPKRGDVVWLHFHPQAGHEQAGRRPAVVLSPESYNQKTSLALFCPVTNQAKGYPFPWSCLCVGWSFATRSRASIGPRAGPNSSANCRKQRLMR